MDRLSYIAFAIFLIPHSTASDARSALCNAWCMARGESEHSLAGNGCVERCRKYSSSSLCPQTKNNCSMDCIDLGRHGSNSTLPEAPVNISALYTGEFADELPNPYEIKLTWSPVEDASYYYLEWKAGNISGFTVLNDTTTEAKIMKKHLCAPVYYRLRSISKDGLSEPSDCGLRVASEVEYGSQCCPMLKVVNYTWFENEDASVTYAYSLPNGWRPDDITKVSIQSPTHPKAKIVVDTGTATFTVSIKRELLYTYAQMVFLIYSMSTRCGGEKTYFDLREETSITLFLDCSSMKMMFPDHPATIERCSACPVKYTCGISSTGPDYVYNCSRIKHSRVPISVAWNLTGILPECPNKPLFWVTRWTIFEEIRNGEASFERAINSTDEISRSTTHDLTSYTMLPMGYIYHFEACAVYNNGTTEGDVMFSSRTAFIRYDLTGDECVTNISDESGSKSIIIGVCLGIIGGIIIAIVCCVCWWSRRKKSIEKMQNDIRATHRANAYTACPNKPKVIDRFEIDRRKVLVFENEILGKGAFGKVFKGQLTTRCGTHPANLTGLVTDQEEAEAPIVAVKQCYSHADEATKQDFRQEIALMKKLYYYPRIVNILQCVTMTEPLLLIVEYCSGGDLLHYLRIRRDYMTRLESLSVDYTNPHQTEAFDQDMVIDFRDVIRMQYQIADGMEYISEKGFIHRDLAARNILVDARRNVKIGDFGLCRFIYTNMAYTARGGKLPIKWMALEAIERYEFTTKSDVWSFAVLAFEIITVGGVPYADVTPENDDIRKAMLDHLRSGGRIERPDNCAPDMYDLMCECWKAQPESRPSFTQVKEFFRRMYESIASDNSSDYGLYIDPNRSYYNLKNVNDDLVTVADPIILPDLSVANGDAARIFAQEDGNPQTSLITPPGSRQSPTSESPSTLDKTGYSNLGFFNSATDDSGYDGTEFCEEAQGGSPRIRASDKGSPASASPHSSTPSVNDDQPMTSRHGYENFPSKLSPAQTNAYDNPLYTDKWKSLSGTRRPPPPIPDDLIRQTDSIPLQDLPSSKDPVNVRRRQNQPSSAKSNVPALSPRNSRSPRQSILDSPLPLVGTSSAIAHQSSHAYANFEKL